MRVVKFILLTGIIVAALTTLASRSDDVTLALHFPKDQNLGELWKVEDVNCFTCGAGEEYIGPATGDYRIRLPAPHWFVSLRMPKQATHLMPYLGEASLKNIEDINLQNSDITDSDLAYLSHINLRSLNLRGTKITGSGFQYLRPPEHFFFLDVTKCSALKPDTLSHFKGWESMALVLVGYKSEDEKYTAPEQALLDEARKLVCDNQSENICHIQIR